MSHIPEPIDPSLPLTHRQQRLRDSARREFPADSPYAALLADDLADTLLCRKALAEISTQTLDTEILAMWDQVSRQYPNADASLRNVLAWKEAHKLPGTQAAFAIRHQSGRSSCRQTAANLRLRLAREDR